MSSAFLEFKTHPRVYWRRALVCLVGGLLASACLTPGFIFDDGPVQPDGTGLGGGGAFPLPSHCSNRQLDTTESDVDCGGECRGCAVGRDCGGDDDCTTLSCIDNVCSTETTCTDGLTNGNETDEDCGGGVCDLCADGLKCRKGSDCDSSVCKSGKCQVPTCTDKVTNGDESDVDCGPGCGGCVLGQKCEVAGDCLQPTNGDSAIVCSAKVCTKTIGSVQDLPDTVDLSGMSDRFMSVTFDRNLAEVGHRALVVAISALNQDEDTIAGTDSIPTQVTFGGKALELLDSDNAEHVPAALIGNQGQSYVGIYLLRECDIAAASSGILNVEFRVADYAGAGMMAMLFENVDQDFSELGRSTTASSVRIELDATLEDQDWFVGSATNQGVDFTAPLSPSPSENKNHIFNGPSDFRSIVTVWGPLGSGPYTFAWGTGQQFQLKAAAGLILKPARAPATACP